MKKYLIFLSFLIIGVNNLLVEKHAKVPKSKEKYAKTVIAKAFNEIILEHFVEKSVQFDIIVCGDKKLIDLAATYFKRNRAESLTKVITIDSTWDKKVSQSAFLLFDSSDTFKKFNKEVSFVNPFPKILNFFVYCAKEASEKFKQNKEIAHYQSNFSPTINITLIMFFKYNFFSQMLIINLSPQKSVNYQHKQ